MIIGREDGHFRVLSDFGNVLKLTREQIDGLYEVSEAWLEVQMFSEMGFIPPMQSVKERLAEQIDNLQNVYNGIEEGEF